MCAHTEALKATALQCLVCSVQCVAGTGDCLYSCTLTGQAVSTPVRAGNILFLLTWAHSQNCECMTTNNMGISFSRLHLLQCKWEKILTVRIQRFYLSVNLTDIVSDNNCPHRDFAD